MLQGFLFLRNGVFPLLLSQFIGGRLHRFRCGIHILLKSGKTLIFVAQLSSVQAARQREGLIVQLALHIGKELGRLIGLLS